MCDHKRDTCIILHRYTESIRPEKPIVCVNGQAIPIVSMEVKLLCECGHIKMDRIRMMKDDEETA